MEGVHPLEDWLEGLFDIFEDEFVVFRVCDDSEVVDEGAFCELAFVVRNDPLLINRSKTSVALLVGRHKGMIEPLLSDQNILSKLVHQGER